jgi:hypothetical protein
MHASSWVDGRPATPAPDGWAPLRAQGEALSPWPSLPASEWGEDDDGPDIGGLERRMERTARLDREQRRR